MQDGICFLTETWSIGIIGTYSEKSWIQMHQPLHKLKLCKLGTQT